ncbi:MAG: Fic-DOC domain mobile mystery protein B [Rhodothermales bacterium]|jgi:Fic-DOC domain mobile mystery protein B
MFEVEPLGATPLDPEEAADLLPTHVYTRAELNAWEQQNILAAAKWARRTRADAIASEFIRGLHRRMFDETWAWAGQLRASDKNIGVDWHTISTETRNLVDDGRYWIQHETFSIDEAALRLHHRLVKIHPFPNGNGRHARLWCDTILLQHDRPVFSWRNRILNESGKSRRAYIDALRAADHLDYRPLFALYLDGRAD